ncbi:PREDICTED: uncharacterized protein LOC105462788 [Wasmannia auropunctata]|uniref:uncharacterized protein LOC105462788 n=1 Tax=Wasmannia auropunctata TaxID=64793 RepID=UPI0005ED5BA5|nr:PREDICTED: uncharacterized protein LOC105462788 [Wasmannia auropunctata]
MELANEFADQAPKIARVIRKDFYMDDLLTGTNSIDEAKEIIQGLSHILGTAGFKLRKWLSNEPSITANIPTKDKLPEDVEFTDGKQMKTLGTYWRAQSDDITFKVKENMQTKITKRHILAEIAKIFDPLGILGPCNIIAKILMQKLWLYKLSWDESLPAELHEKWSAFRKQMQEINKIKIPRSVVGKDCTSLQLHAFSDASLNAYGACVYIRSQDPEGNYQVSLLCAKSRVAPLQQQTIPRLELCAALLLARLVAKAVQSLGISFEKITCWSDSTIVLSWLRMQSGTLQTFVSNRVAEVQRLTEAYEWRHVPTAENPADLLSRGLDAGKLSKSRLWWNGPSFLAEDASNWPQTRIIEDSLLEVKKEHCMLGQTRSAEPSIFEGKSSARRLIRTIAYCRRFANNCKGKGQRRTDPIAAAELNEALHMLLKIAQRESYPKEIKDIVANKRSSAQIKKLNPLNPFIDSEGILRVGGRLGNSNFDNDKKHPIIVSAKHPFTKLLFKDEHLRLLHAGPQLLLSSIREKLWVVGGRNLAKRIVHDCIRCFRNKPRQAQALMGELPKARVSISMPFHVTGVDYAGPFSIKDRKGRGCKTSKCYICLFICFSIKAVHLELVSDMTSEAFIAALRRFSARRGKPAHIYSDNGASFVGSNRELKELGELMEKEGASISEAINDMGINWHFIPAYSPHFGGLWESGVKATKHHLKRIAGNLALTFEEFSTLLSQIEATLNSRPLTPLSSDPNDLTPLTPAHFLIGRTFTSMADPSLTHLSENRLSRWQLVQSLHQHFWKRWSKEYISELQQRTKWKEPVKSIQENTMVLIKDNTLPPFKWKLARVVTVHPGRDDIVRAVTVKTATGNIRIATAKLCPLPLDDCDQNQ